MLNTQNQTLITVVCVCVSVTAPLKHFVLVYFLMESDIHFFIGVVTFFFVSSIL
jgi:hypothetical protein